jgi:hypothetical protein
MYQTFSEGPALERERVVNSLPQYYKPYFGTILSFHSNGIIIIIIIIIISCHRFSFFPGTSPLETVVNPTTQASSLSL